ncbi:MAG TPA: DCC1-like thiol-disulfide oxidoreductase family protein [Actinomycetota bacterium]|nr:DCC1-like thiol-disulfide oxidoreductase family protein [Actinomycetota bacterium]
MQVGRIETFDLLYDEDCGLCRAAARAAVRLARPGALRATGLRTARAARLLPGLTGDERLRSFHLAAPDGRTWSAGDAVAPTLGLLPALRPVAGAMRRVPALGRATTSSYDWVAGHRASVAAWLPESWKRPLTEREAGPPASRPGASAYDRPGSGRSGR